MVNGRSLVGLTHNEADLFLKSLPAMVQLVVATEVFVVCFVFAFCLSLPLCHLPLCKELSLHKAHKVVYIAIVILKPQYKLTPFDCTLPYISDWIYKN